MEETEKRITPWRVLKWTLFAISMLVYLAVFVRLFVACDADISDDIILTSEQMKDFENYNIDYGLYNYQPSSWTNEEGTLQIKNIYYLEPISQLQLTVRYKTQAFADRSLTFKLRTVDTDEKVTAQEGESLYQEDLPGITLDSTEAYTETRYAYTYVRLCTSDITVDDGERRTERVQTVDEDGNVTYTTRTVTDGGNKVYLDIYDSDTLELLYSFDVAGKTMGGVRTRRSKVEVRVKD